MTSVVDSRIFRNLFGTERIRNVSSDEAYAHRIIDTEAALARAESTIGVVPVEIGEQLTEALKDITLE